MSLRNATPSAERSGSDGAAAPLTSSGSRDERIAVTPTSRQAAMLLMATAPQRLVLRGRLSRRPDVSKKQLPTLRVRCWQRDNLALLPLFLGRGALNDTAAGEPGARHGACRSKGTFSTARHGKRRDGERRVGRSERSERSRQAAC